MNQEAKTKTDINEMRFGEELGFMRQLNTIRVKKAITIPKKVFL